MGTLWSIVPPRLAAGKSLGDVAITAPIQRGCIALSVPADSDVQSLADLRGAKIAGSEFLYATAIAEGVGALMQVFGETRMIAMNNMPPAEGNYCCACIMAASAIRGDTPRAAAITRALMRGSAWAEAHRSETAALMRDSMVVPVRRDLTQEDMEKPTMSAARTTRRSPGRGRW